MSQPTLSIAVNKLEEKLGVALFERGKIAVIVALIVDGFHKYQKVKYTGRVMDEYSTANLAGRIEVSDA